MNYKLNSKVNTDAHTGEVGNSIYNIGSSVTDRFSNIWSRNFKGDSTASYYADLAEKYTVYSDDYFPVGTVMEVSSYDNDCQSCNQELSPFVMGIVSEKPGYLMNADLENSAVVGLVGTVPVRAVGIIKKKDILVSTVNGCVRAAKDSSEYVFKVAIALESNDNVDEKLVKCFIK